MGVPRLPLPVALFLVALLLPWEFKLGAVTLTPYRFVLMATTIPCLWLWLRGSAGPVRSFDLALFLNTLWVGFCLIVLVGVGEAWKPGFSYFVESFGAFLLARCFIRSQDNLYAMARCFFVIAVLLLPWAVAEAISHRNFLLDIFAQVAPTSPAISEAERLGLRRAQAIFEHPILFGVFAVSTFAYVHLVFGGAKSPSRRWLQSAAVAACVFLSLSSAPIGAFLLQVGILAWGYVLRGTELRWMLLLAITASAYLFVEVFSNQSAIGAYITRFTFSEQSAFYRMLIWDYGWNSVLRHPLFGIGFGDWQRPSWMTSSVDNFWLVNAIRWGLPGVFLLMFSVALLWLQVVRTPQHEAARSRCKLAYLVSTLSCCIMGMTVHYWGSSYVIFMFLLGSGAWLLDATGRAPGAGGREPYVRMRDGPPTEKSARRPFGKAAAIASRNIDRKGSDR